MLARKKNSNFRRQSQRNALTDILDQKPASTELTGGAGFTYEDTVVAYYLAHLLRHERAAGQPGIVTSVAVQRQGHGHPMDDVIVGLDDAGTKKSLDLQVKRSVTISGADRQFKEIVAAAVKTQGSDAFVKVRTRVDLSLNMSRIRRSEAFRV
jgi:hypothetical protein